MNQLPLWDVFQIYLYIQWYKVRERLHWLAWKWFLFQWKLGEENRRSKSQGDFLINKNKLCLRYIGWAFLTGGVLAGYISLTMFWQMPYDLWRAFNNLLLVISLLVTAFAGYQHRMFGISFKFMLLSITLFFMVIMLLYLGSYIITTTALVDKMVWIPFFYHDYNYHGFQSVTDYLNHENNYRELLRLQVFSLSMSSVLYFGVGSLGYIIKALIERTHGSSGTAPSGD